MNGGFNFIYGKRHIGLFGQRHHHPHHITLLEGIRCNHTGGNLAGDGQNGYRVHVGIGDTGDQVHGTGARRGHADTGPGMGCRQGCPRYALGHKGRSLLMPRHDQ